MKEQIIDSWWFTYVWVMVISLWGGAVAYFEKKEPFNGKKLCVTLLSASFAGMMTLYICQAGHVPTPLTGAFCGVAAHMGTPALLRMKLIRQFFETDKKE